MDGIQQRFHFVLVDCSLPQLKECLEELSTPPESASDLPLVVAQDACEKTWERVDALHRVYNLAALEERLRLQPCKSGKRHQMCLNALCTMDDASYFLVVRLGPKTSQCEKNVIVMSTVTSCGVTNCATTLHGFNKHASSRREAVSVSRSVHRYTE